MPSIDTVAVFSSQATSFDTGDAITAAAASGAVYDGFIARNLGLGEEIKLVAQLSVAMTSATGNEATLTVALQTSPDNGTWTTVQTIGTFAAASAIGTKLEAFLQPGLVNNRYLRLYYTPNIENLTAGSVVAYLTDAFDDHTNYPVGTIIAGS